MKYTLATAERIAEKVAAGVLLRDVAKDKNMLLLATLRRWRKRHPEFAELLEHAYVDLAETHLAEMADIRAELKGELDLGAVGSAKARLSNLEWLMSRLDKARFGSHATIEHKSKDLVSAIFAARTRRDEPIALPATAQPEAIDVEVIPEPVQVAEQAPAPKMVTVVI